MRALIYYLIICLTIILLSYSAAIHDTSEDDLQPTFLFFHAPVTDEIYENCDFVDLCRISNQDKSDYKEPSLLLNSSKYLNGAHLDSTSPNIAVAKAHRVAMTSYYQSAELPTLRDMVWVFREALETFHMI